MYDDFFIHSVPTNAGGSKYTIILEQVTKTGSTINITQIADSGIQNGFKISL